MVICDHHGLFDFPFVMLLLLLLLIIFACSFGFFQTVVALLTVFLFFFFYLVLHLMSFPGGSDGKESAMQETWVQSLG